MKNVREQTCFRKAKMNVFYGPDKSKLLKKNKNNKVKSGVGGGTSG